MALEKLKILVESEENTFDQEITVLFNPNQISIDKSSRWCLTPTAQRDTPKSQFTYGHPAGLNMDLFFDTYEAKTDVRKHTKKIFELTTIQEHGELHRPPLCKLVWGDFDFDDDKWVLVQLNQRFMVFLENGIPVRATLTCAFKQWRSDETEARLLQKASADLVKSYTVKLGDTISGIAAKKYKNPTYWRYIAEENNIANPRLLEPGRVLTIPKITKGSS